MVHHELHGALHFQLRRWPFVSSSSGALLYEGLRLVAAGSYQLRWCVYPDPGFHKLYLGTLVPWPRQAASCHHNYAHHDGIVHLEGQSYLL